MKSLAELVPVGPFYPRTVSNLDLTPSDFSKALFGHYFESRLTETTSQLFTEGAYPCIPDPLKNQLFTDIAARIIKPLVLEMNIARLAGILQGDDSDQYSDFIALLQDGNYLLYLQTKYPILFSTEKVSIDNTIAATLELFARLEADRAVIASELHVTSQEVSNIIFTGDPHRSGRRSAIITFTDDTRLAYKPRSGEMDTFYSNIVKLVSSKAKAPLPLANFVCRRTHTWQQFITRSDPSNELKHYQQLGVWLALGHYTGLSDLHYENVIQTKEGPYVIDFECGVSTQVVDEGSAAEPPRLFVSSVGVLPHWVGAREGHPGMNWGAIGGIPEQAPAMKVRSLTNYGTSAMQLEMQDLREIVKVKSLPIVSTEHEKALIQGFTSGRKSLIGCASEVLKLASSNAIKTRVIVRPTQIYSDAQRKSSYPLHFQNTMDRITAIRSVLDVHNASTLQNIEVFESELLSAGDFPLYLATLTSDKAYECTGGSQKIGVSVRKPIDVLKHRLASATDETDFLRQLRLIRQTIAVYQNITNETSVTDPRRIEGNELSNPHLPAVRIPTSDEPSYTAHRASKEITDDSWESDLGYKWLNAILLAGKESTLQESGADLYHGSLGTILALVTSHIAFDTHLDLEKVRTTINSYRKDLLTPEPTPPLGAFNGITGQIYTLANISLLIPALTEITAPTILDALTVLETNIPRLYSYDLIAGHAGIVAVLAELSRRQVIDHSTALRISKISVESLRETASIDDHLTVWKLDGERWLGGFSHGVAGVAWALDQIPDPRARALGAMARATQDSLRVGSTTRWRDLRSFPADVDDFEAWCHGSDGILLSMATSEGTDRPSDFTDLVRGWLAQEVVENPSLCHGRAGRLVALCFFRDNTEELDLSRISHEIALNVKKYRKAVLTDLQLILNSQNHPLRLNSSIMLGYPGLLYALALEATNSRVGNILRLELPDINFN